MRAYRVLHAGAEKLPSDGNFHGNWNEELVKWVGWKFYYRGMGSRMGAIRAGI